MKVAMVTSFPTDPAAPCGGVEAVSVNLVEALSMIDDLDVHVVTTDRTVRAATQDTWKGATVHRLPRSRSRVLIDAIGPGRRQMCRFLRRLEPDVVHAHDVYGLMIKGLATPSVYTIHGFIHGDTRVSGEPFARVRSVVWRRIETAGWARQRHIISISPYVRERLSRVARGVIHDVENPIAPSFFETPRREGSLTVFSAAVVSPRKNTLALVDAVSHVVRAGIDVRLRLAGAAIDPAYASRVRERIEDQGLTDRTTWLGAITSDAIRRELAAASVFALVSLEENAPLGIEEAMAVGVPVVASNRCGMPYLVRHGETGYLVNPHDSREIGHQIARLLKADRLRREMGEAGGTAARARFHPAAVARRTREVYFEAVCGGGTSDPRECH